MSFYAIGDPAPDGDFDGPCCPDFQPGDWAFACTRPKDHEMPHVASGTNEKIVAVWG